MHIVLVHVHVKPDWIEDFKSACLDNAGNSNQEAGVIKFDVVQQADDLAHFILIEMYKDENAARDHKTTAHYLRWRDRVAEMMAEPRQGILFNEVYVRREDA